MQIPQSEFIISGDSLIEGNFLATKLLRKHQPSLDIRVNTVRILALQSHRPLSGADSILLVANFVAPKNGSREEKKGRKGCVKGRNK